MGREVPDQFDRGPSSTHALRRGGKHHGAFSRQREHSVRHMGQGDYTGCDERQPWLLVGWMDSRATNSGRVREGWGCLEKGWRRSFVEMGRRDCQLPLRERLQESLLGQANCRGNPEWGVQATGEFV